MRAALLAILFLCLGASASRAVTPEDAYLQARDKYLAKIKAMEKAKASSDKVDAENSRDSADLEKRLRDIIGEMKVKDFPPGGKLNLGALSQSDIGYGMLDGLVYSDSDGNWPQLVVTTPDLLSKWLVAAAKEKDRSNRLPADLKSALDLDQFYTSSIGSDAAFTKDANLAVTRPDGVELAHAVLGGWAQDIGPNPNRLVVVTLIKGDRVYIGSMQPKTAIGEIAACQEIWTRFQQEAEAKRSASTKQSEKEFEANQKREAKADADFHACFIKSAPTQAFYPALAAEAQAFVDRIAGK
jgi:hypothetical protein